MASSNKNQVKITVEVSGKGGGNNSNLSDIPLSTTVGEVKKKLNVAANSRFGRPDKFENWDNSRSLADYFVKDGEKFTCVVQCGIEDGQPSFDDYKEWLKENPQ